MKDVIAEALAAVRKERAQLEHIEAALETLVTGNSTRPSKKTKRVMSASARRRISQAQKARWRTWKRNRRTA